MPLHTVEIKRLYRQIADQLRTLVERGEFAVGARLPAERELAQLLGVSRPSVREALIALEVEGVVEVRTGSGVYVLDRPKGAARLPGSVESPLETLAARELIESELAARAALRFTAAQRRALDAALAQMRAAIASDRSPAEGDRAFHVCLVEGAGNAVLARLVTGLFDERLNPLYAQLGSHFEDARSWRRALAEHQAVADAIAARDADAARAAMRRHLAASRKRFTAAIAPRGAARRVAAAPLQPLARAAVRRSESPTPAVRAAPIARTAARTGRTLGAVASNRLAPIRSPE